MLGLTAIPAVVQLLLLPFFPESPRYLLIQRGDEKTAQKGERLSRGQKRVKKESLTAHVLPHPRPAALQRLRGWDQVEEELSEMRLEDQSEKAEGRLSVLSLLSQRSLRWQLFSIIAMNMGQQLSGVNAVGCPQLAVPPPESTKPDCSVAPTLVLCLPSPDLLLR